MPGTRYRYRVIAFTLDGYRSEPAVVEVLFIAAQGGARDGEDEGAAAPAQVDHSGTGQ